MQTSSPGDAPCAATTPAPSPTCLDFPVFSPVPGYLLGMMAENALLREFVLAFIARPRLPHTSLALAESLDIRYPQNIPGIALNPSFVDVLTQLRTKRYLVFQHGHEEIAPAIVEIMTHQTLMRCVRCGVHTDEVDACWMCERRDELTSLIAKFEEVVCCTGGYVIARARLLPNNAPKDTMPSSDDLATDPVRVTMPLGTMKIGFGGARYFLFDSSKDERMVLRLQRLGRDNVITFLDLDTACSEIPNLVRLLVR